MFETVKRYLDEFKRLGIPSTDILIYHDGKEVFRQMHGTSDEIGTPLSGAEKYNIYSCSKPITCAAALTLLQEGKFSLDDEVAAYLPPFKDMTMQKSGAIVKAEKPIKISHLFTMTAGLNYATASEEINEGKLTTDGKCPTVEMMNYIAKMPLDFEAGESWGYSLCHDVLAALVEVVSGKRFGLYVKEKIFDPLDMKDTTFSLPEEEVQNLCAQYRFDGNDFVNVGRNIVSYKFGSDYESGGAGGISTVNDYMKFLEGMRTGKILFPETVARMKTDLLTDRQRPAYWGAQGYGYGLGIRVPQKGFPRTDYGWGGAAGAYLALDEKNKICVYYAQHVLNSPNGNLRKDLIEAAKLDLGFEAYEEDMWQGKGSTLA